MSRFNKDPHGGFQGNGFEVQSGQFAEPETDEATSNVAAFPERKRASGPSNTQVMIWSLLGLGALGYLTFAMLAPDLMSSALPADASTRTLDKVGQDVAALQDEVTTLRQVVDTQSEQTRQIKATLNDQTGGVEELRRQVTSVASGQQALDDRLAQVEALKGTNKQSNRAVPIQPATSQNAAVNPAEPAVDSGLDGLVMDDPNAAAPVAKPKPVAKIVPPTPLVPKVQTVQAEAQAPAADGRVFGVELAISESPQALRLNWELMNEQHQAALQGLQAKSAPSGANFRLLAGPFANAQQATAACGRLKQRGLFCKPTPFVGTAL
jgi:SPOR domain